MEGNITCHLEKSFLNAQELQRLEKKKDELLQLTVAGNNVSEQDTVVNKSLSTLNDEKIKLNENRPSSYNIVIDNIDLRVLASDMTSDDQNKDLHWCNHNAYLDRVNPTNLSDNAPIADLQDVPNSIFLPSLNDHNLLQTDFTVLIGRVLVENFPVFSIFRDAIPQCIKHTYSEEMKQKLQR